MHTLAVDAAKECVHPCHMAAAVAVADVAVAVVIVRDLRSC